MLKLILNRIGKGLLVLLGVITIIFLLFQLQKDSVARSLAGKQPTPELIEAIEHKLGLDLPVYKQYILYLNDISPISVHSIDPENVNFLDSTKYDYQELFGLGSNNVLVFKSPYLRTSFVTQNKVTQVIGENLPQTALLATTAITIGVIIGIFFGIIASLNKGSYFDRAILVYSALGMSLPSYFSGIIFLLIFSSAWYELTFIPILPLLLLAIGLIVGATLNKKDRSKDSFSWNTFLKRGGQFFGLGLVIWFVGLGVNGLFEVNVIPGVDWYLLFPGTGMDTGGPILDMDDLGNEFYNWNHLLLPALTLGIRPLAIVTQLTRSSMLDVLSQDYIRTAKAKGVSKWNLVVKHALKNSLNPVVTAVSGWFASLLAGAVFVENIFSYNGLGSQLVKALEQNDLPVIMGIVLVGALFFVIINT